MVNVYPRDWCVWREGYRGPYLLVATRVTPKMVYAAGVHRKELRYTKDGILFAGYGDIANRLREELERSERMYHQSMEDALKDREVRDAAVIKQAKEHQAARGVVA